MHGHERHEFIDANIGRPAKVMYNLSSVHIYIKKFDRSACFDDNCKIPKYSITVAGTRVYGLGVTYSAFFHTLQRNLKGLMNCRLKRPEDRSAQTSKKKNLKKYLSSDEVQ